ncbi:MAG TPA: hypothetical protein VEB22_04535 [Phycisphaerales bacterium]|nr:hypothetical protein [Phycisphaerales bacterium]
MIHKGQPITFPLCDGLRFDWVDYKLTGGESPAPGLQDVLGESDVNKVVRPAAMQYGWPVRAWESWYNASFATTGTFHVPGQNRVAFPVAGIPIWYFVDDPNEQLCRVRRLLPVVPRPFPALVNAAVWSLPAAVLIFGWRGLLHGDVVPLPARDADTQEPGLAQTPRALSAARPP